jgi:hypothetical protein
LTGQALINAVVLQMGNDTVQMGNELVQQGALPQIPGLDSIGTGLTGSGSTGVDGIGSSGSTGSGTGNDSSGSAGNGTGYGGVGVPADLPTTGNANTDALASIQAISENPTSYSDFDFQNVASDSSALTSLFSAANDPNAVNDFVNAFNNDVVPPASAIINASAQYAKEYSSVGDPFSNVASDLATVQQENPGLTGQALINAVVQQMGNDTVQMGDELVQQGALPQIPGF